VSVVARGKVAGWKDKNELLDHISARHLGRDENELTVMEYATAARISSSHAGKILSQAVLNGATVDGCTIARRKVGNSYVYRFERIA
jgi:hypothetical protein